MFPTEKLTVGGINSTPSCRRSLIQSDVDIRVDDDATHSGKDRSDTALATDGSEDLTRPFLGKDQVQGPVEGLGVGPGAEDTSRTVELSLVESEMLVPDDRAHVAERPTKSTVYADNPPG